MQHIVGDDFWSGHHFCVSANGCLHANGVHKVYFLKQLARAQAV
jgi:hypothetical protein